MKKSLVMATLVLTVFAAAAQPQATPALTFAPLPYAFDALEPYIDAQTMEIHYTKHHRAYFDNLVKAIKMTDVEKLSLEVLLNHISELSTTVRNNAGGHYNHTLYWRCMSPTGGGEPKGELADAINAAFGSVAKFKELFAQAALARFGSGWVWLCLDAKGDLFITSTANQDNPLMDIAERRGYPLLGLDVWEHAYYLKYKNLRGSYVDAFWNVVNWDEVAARFLPAAKPSPAATINN